MISKVSSKHCERQPAHAIPVASPGLVANADGNAHLPVAVDEKTIASPAHAVELAKDSGSDHSETQAGDAEKGDLTILTH